MIGTVIETWIVDGDVYWYKNGIKHRRCSCLGDRRFCNKILM
jgi:hypothetical protein